MNENEIANEITEALKSSDNIIRIVFKNGSTKFITKSKEKNDINDDDIIQIFSISEKRDNLINLNDIQSYVILDKKYTFF